MVQGHIYVITNKVNGKQYVGQTSRDIDVRFDEHCYDSRSTSSIHKAIVKYGRLNFKLEELETVNLSLLDEREQYWIQKLDTYRNGYNQNRGGDQSCSKYDNIQIVENGFIIDSCEYLAREVCRLTDWSFRFLADKIRQAVDSDKDFLGYHIKSIKAYKTDLTDICDLENWIKTLNVKYQGQHIFCDELNMGFDTIGEAARYLVENGHYTGNSQMPIPTVVSIISKLLKDGTQSSVLNNFSFYRAPGTTKQKGNDNPFQNQKVYCPNLDMTFDSCAEAARYLVDNKIWAGIKVKTARCRISDVLNDIFPHYRNFTFERVNE